MLHCFTDQDITLQHNRGKGQWWEMCSDPIKQTKNTHLQVKVLHLKSFLSKSKVS